MITETFVPVKVQIQEQPQVFERFNANWTPTQIILDADGKERYRVEGFLPADDLIAQLSLGLARLGFEEKKYSEAEKRFNGVCIQYPNAGVAPEACYWAGVAAYKATNNAEKLRETYRQLKDRYPDNEWARKASVWQ